MLASQVNTSHYEVSASLFSGTKAFLKPPYTVVTTALSFNRMGRGMKERKLKVRGIRVANMLSYASKY
jgi:hypothetical protein